MKKNNKVFLCTNSKNETIINQIEEVFNLPVLTRIHKKPSLKIIEGIDLSNGAVVIGDKAAIDGLFALRLGAEFIRVDRKISGRETVVNKMIYFIDDLLWKIIKKFLRLIRK